MRLFALTALTMTAFAANSVLNRLAVGSGAIDPIGFAVIRLCAGAAMLGLILMLRCAQMPRPRPAGAAALLVYLFGFSAAYLALDAGVGALILFGVVQITMFLGAVMARDPIPALRVVGAVLAMLGLAVLLAPGTAAISLPHAAAMALAGVGWGVYSLLGRVETDALGATAMSFILAVPVGLMALPWAGTMTEYGVGFAVLSGAVTSGLGYALWYFVLPDLGRTRGAVAQLSVPVIAALGGLVLIGEPVSLRVVFATLLVIGGVCVALMPARRA